MYIAGPIYCILHVQYIVYCRSNILYIAGPIYCIFLKGPIYHIFQVQYMAIKTSGFCPEFILYKQNTCVSLSAIINSLWNLMPTGSLWTGRSTPKHFGSYRLIHKMSYGHQCHELVQVVVK